MTSPVWMPIRTGKPEDEAPFAACRMTSAARHAARGWSSRLSKAPKPERMPSPLTSKTVPPCSRTAAAIALTIGLMRSMAASASMALMALVDPLMSAKRTVTTLREAWLAAWLEPWASRGVPQSLQNLAPVGLGNPQRGQGVPCRADIFTDTALHGFGVGCSLTDWLV